MAKLDTFLLLTATSKPTKLKRGTYCCVSKVTVFTEMRHNVTMHVHCLSCYWKWTQISVVCSLENLKLRLVQLYNGLSVDKLVGWNCCISMACRSRTHALVCRNEIAIYQYMTQWCLVHRYKQYWGTCCLNFESLRDFLLPWRWRQQGPPKHRHLRISNTQSHPRRQ